MKRSTVAGLVAIALLAILVRLLPLLRGLYWGADVGEYHAITGALVADGFVTTAYRGWGVTYPYLPGMFLVNAGLVYGGLPPDAATTFAVPILGALGILPLFLLAVRVTGDDGAGLVAAAFLGVVMFHAYATSHAVPATLGDFLLLAALLMFLRLRDDPKWLGLLVPTGLAIVVTHHLATYVLLAAGLGTLFLRAALAERFRVRGVIPELAFLIGLFLATIAFWIGHAVPLWELVSAETAISLPILLVAFGATVAGIPLLAAVRRRVRWRYRPRVRTLPGARIAAGLAAAAGFGIIGVATVAPIPGTTIRLEPVHLILFAPTVGLLSLAAAGRRTLDFSRDGRDVTGWFLILLASIAIGIGVAPEVLIPYRHLEYVAIPLAVMVGAGARWVTVAANPSGTARAAVIVALLLVGAAVAAIPPPSALAGWDESVSPRTVEAALWLRAHGNGLVAADHLRSSVVFGFGGLDATWDRETGMWHAPTDEDARSAMASVPVPGGSARVDWVLIDGGLRAGVQISPFAPAKPLLAAEEAALTNGAHKLYDSGNAQVYFVNWGLPGP